jgi:hypothetical protein
MQDNKKWNGRRLGVGDAAHGRKDKRCAEADRSHADDATGKQFLDREYQSNESSFSQHSDAAW